MHTILGGGNSNIFTDVLCSPLFGEDEHFHFDEHMFQMVQQELIDKLISEN